MTMHTHLCTGLDGANPLHMLAALGAFVLIERTNPGAKMGWEKEQGAWRPFFVTEQDFEKLADDLAEWLNLLARTESANKGLSQAIAKLKKRLKDDKDHYTLIKRQARLAKTSDPESKNSYGAKLKEAELAINVLQAQLDGATQELSDAYGKGIAHVGDVIGVSPAVVRQAALDALDGWNACRNVIDKRRDDPVLLVKMLAAFSCDQIIMNGKAVPTRYSFGNGSGGQCLLKDWRALADQAQKTNIKHTLLGHKESRFVSGLTNLNWDPAANRDYASSWHSPEDTKNNPKQTDLGANALAFLGLAMLPSMPSKGRLVAVGWGPGDCWTWPIWHSALSFNTVGSLLSHPGLTIDHPDLIELTRMGIVEVRRSVRIDPTGQGRFYFAPSRPV